MAKISESEMAKWRNEENGGEMETYHQHQ